MRQQKRESSWRSTQDILSEVMSIRADNLTTKQKSVIDAFFQVVDAWKAGELPIQEAKELTGDGWLRAQVIMNTPPNHDKYLTAMEFFDALIDLQDGIRTTSGWISQAEIKEQGGREQKRYNHATGEIYDVIQFPYGVDKDTSRILWPAPQEREEVSTHQDSPFESDWY